MSATSQVSIDEILGPVNISVNFNSFLFGLIAFQIFKYFETGYHDHWSVKFLVVWLLIVDTLTSAIDGYLSWNYTIQNFNNPGILPLSTWPYSIIPIETVLVSYPVQLFFAYRVFVLTGRRLWAIIVIVLATIQFLSGIGTGIGALMLSRIADFTRIQPICAVWFSTNVACDVVISTTLVITLSGARRGWSTDHIINRIMRTVIETASLSSVFCILHLIMFFGLSDTNLHLIFGVPLARIYSNAFLATLNARAHFREASSSALQSPSVGRTFTPGRSHKSEHVVNVSVEREVHLEDLQSCKPLDSASSDRFCYNDGMKIDGTIHRLEED